MLKKKKYFLFPYIYSLNVSFICNLFFFIIYSLFSLLFRYFIYLLLIFIMTEINAYQKILEDLRQTQLTKIMAYLLVPYKAIASLGEKFNLINAAMERVKCIND
jgi:hypothetical protein